MQVRPQERPFTYPAPNPILPKLRSNILPRPKTTLLQPQPTQQHLTKTQTQHPIPIKSRHSIRIIRPTILTMNMELPMSQLGHQIRHICSLLFGVVAICAGRLVGVSETAEIWGDEGEVLGEERPEAVPVEGVLWRAWSLIQPLDPGSDASDY